MLLGFPIWGDVAAVLTISDRTEVRATAGRYGATTLLDVETRPEARVTLASPRTRYAFSYGPELTLPGVNVSSVHPVLLQSGAARGEWFSRRVHLSFDQTASYGDVDFSRVGIEPGLDGTLPPVEVVPAPQVVDFVSSTTTLSSLLTFRRWTSELSLGYQVSGGSTEESQELIPLQSGPFGEFSVTHLVSRTDNFTTTVSASQASFSSGSKSLLTQVDQGWQHLWSRVSKTQLTLGLSEAQMRTSSSAPSTRRTYGVAEGAFDHRLPLFEGRVDVRLGLRLGPVVNRLVGLVDQQVQGTLALTDTRGRFVSHAYVSAAESVSTDGPAAVRLLSGELGAAYGAGETLTFDFGVRGFWQRQDPAVADLLQGTVFAGLSVRAAPMRL